MLYIALLCGALAIAAACIRWLLSREERPVTYTYPGPGYSRGRALWFIEEERREGLRR